MSTKIAQVVHLDGSPVYAGPTRPNASMFQVLDGPRAGMRGADVALFDAVGHIVWDRSKEIVLETGQIREPLPKLTEAQRLTVAHLARISTTLDQMQAALEQERADLGCADYCTASELAHIAGKLDEIAQFWTQSGPEYAEHEPPPAYWSETLGQLVTVPED